MEKVWVKIHHQEGTVILAACDEHCLGQTLMDERAEIFIRPAFYQGELLEASELEEQLKSYTNANLVGSACVKAAQNQGLLNQTDAKVVSGIPLAIIIKV